MKSRLGTPRYNAPSAGAIRDGRGRFYPLWCAPTACIQTQNASRTVLALVEGSGADAGCAMPEAVTVSAAAVMTKNLLRRYRLSKWASWMRRYQSSCRCSRRAWSFGNNCGSASWIVFQTMSKSISK